MALLCVENNLMISTIFDREYTYKQIINFMILSGAHGNYDAFVVFHNYLENILGYKIYRLNTIMLLVSYYKYYYANIYKTDQHKKLFLYSDNIQQDERLYSDGTSHYTSDGYDKILERFNNSDENIFKKFNQSVIKNLFIMSINNNSASDALFFVEHVNKMDNISLHKIFAKIKLNMLGDLNKTIELKNYLIKKFGSPGKIILRDYDPIINIKINTGGIHNIKIINMFKKYYLNVYSE